MQFQSNITDHFCEYPISSPLMSYATEWEHKYSSKEKNSFKHYHSLPEIGICIDGCGMFFVGDKAYTFNPGSILYIPAYVPHIISHDACKKASRWKYIWVRPDLFKDSCAFDILPHEVITHDYSCSKLINMMYTEITENKSDTELYISLCTAFARMMHRHISSTDECFDEKSKQIILPAVEYIALHFSENISIPRLAELVHLSESSLRRSFHIATGMSPYEYICYIRISAAKNLLENTDMTVLNISEECGFDSLSSFNRQFSKICKTTPTIFRKNTRYS